MRVSVPDFLSRRLFAIGETGVTVSAARTRFGRPIRPGKSVGYAIIVVGVLVALQSLGIPTNTLAVFGGALGVGLGFGLQDLVKNFAAGLVLLIDGSVQVGDRIVVGDAVGKVVEIRAWDPLRRHGFCTASIGEVTHHEP